VAFAFVTLVIETLPPKCRGVKRRFHQGSVFRAAAGAIWLSWLSWGIKNAGGALGAARVRDSDDAGLWSNLLRFRRPIRLPHEAAPSWTRAGRRPVR
jgi:hypothetical protein